MYVHVYMYKCRLGFVLQVIDFFCYLEDTSGVNLFQTIFRFFKILGCFQVNKKLQKSETNVYMISYETYIYI